MPFREILVHLKSHEEWSPHLDYAIETAKLHSASLRGLVTFAEASFLQSLTRVGDEDWEARIKDGELEAQFAKDQEIAEELSVVFLAACEKAGVRGKLDVGEGPASEIMPWAARLHDLTILEQRHPGYDELGYDPAEETALAAGRPVLLVPRRGRFTPSPDHILVAWNGSHQAASALHGALPFIERAKKVTICSGELRTPLRTSIRVPDLSITTHLKAHVKDVREEKVEVGASSVGEHLLNRANELDCGMIVMGTYGRSWFSEYMLGGATRFILSNMSVPILTGR